MQTQFFVSHNGSPLGPWSVADIVQKIGSKELDLGDYCFDEAQNDWVLLAEHAAFAAVLKNFSPNAPKRPEPPRPLSQSAVIEWYVLKGQNKFGPFSYNDLIRMLQEKSIFEFDYVWHADLGAWQRIAEVEDFTAEKIKVLHTANKESSSELFFRRRHARSDFTSSILIHDNKHVWKGQSVEVSAGGAGVVIENATLQPGQTLYLHFKPADGIPPFNAVCEVVSKQYQKGVKGKDSTVRYGLKFTSINSHVQKRLTEYTQKKTTTRAA